MNRSVNLPYETPMFASTQGTAAACIAMTGHPTAFNQMLHQATSLFCTTKFLNGYTTPEVTIPYTGIQYFKCIEQYVANFRLVPNNYLDIIKQMLGEGFYVVYTGVDDYYLPNKSWYGTRHMYHDGIICGYDVVEGTFSIAAYDINWVFRLISVPIDCFVQAVESAMSENVYGIFTAYRVKANTVVDLDEGEILENLKTYMDSDFEKYPVGAAGSAWGCVVHKYLALYVDMLRDGKIPYDKMDWRILRPVWEHKKCMLMRIQKVEQKLGWNSELSDAYAPIVDKANRVRMAYAMYHRKRRDSMLDGIRNDLLDVGKMDRQLVGEFIDKLETV